MIAYFVHNSETQTDSIYLPDSESFFAVDSARMSFFISKVPDFTRWPGEKSMPLPPEQFGGVIAIREDKGEVEVLSPDLWQQRLTEHLVYPKLMQGYQKHETK